MALPGSILAHPLKIVGATHTLGTIQPDVAETMGFNDQSHFIRHFKHIMGITPGQYKGKSQIGRAVKIG